MKSDSCWTHAQKGLGSKIAGATLSSNSLMQTVYTHCTWQPTARVMTHVTCRLTTKNRDQLRNPTLGNRVLAIFTFLLLIIYVISDKNNL